MAQIVRDPAAPDFVHRHVNLADARLGALALACTDDFFADRQRMLNPAPAQFIPGKYDLHGKWMDGWESRRRRGPGHDWCVVRLARPGLIFGLDLDTSHFTGNFPPAAAVEGCLLDSGDPGPDTDWQPLLPTVALQGNQHHYFATPGGTEVSHLRVHLYPDGGLARLRAYGRPRFDAEEQDLDGWVDLASALQGAVVIAANDEHFGAASNLLLPGRGLDMGDGWETRRRREPGHDWCLIELARPGIIAAVEVDTAHFKGNFPDRFSLQGALLQDAAPAQTRIPQSMFWPQLLSEQSLRMDAIDRFVIAEDQRQPVSHVRFNIIPDGGVSRLRLLGDPL